MSGQMENASGENIKKGALYALCAFFFMAILSTLLKAATLGGSASWANFIAYCSSSLILLFFLFRQGTEVLATNRLSLHFSRALFGVLASLAYCYSTNYIPLLNATLLSNTTPIFIPILALLILKAKSSLKTWISVLLGFMGIACVIHPNSTILEHPGDILGLSSGLSLAMAYICMKMLTRTDSQVRILFYFFFIATAIQVPLLPWFGSLPPLNNMIYALVAGIAFIIAQWWIIKSYQYASPAVVGVFQYSTVIFSAVFDWIIWGAIPTLTDILGTAIVILSVLLIIKNTQPTTQQVKR